ncbi:MAG: hypothetical protein K2O67_06810 [Clostridia bacterium]|nr:hypothetical protein [Clostridia bacterium]
MKNKLIIALAAVGAAALAAWGGYVFCTQVTIGEEPQLYAMIPVYIILVALGGFFVEMVHEGAHFLFGAMLSMGVKVPKIRLFKSSSVEVFPKGAKGLRARFIITAGAGLFFDFLLIALGVVAFAVPSVTPVLGIMLPYAFYQFVVNVIPTEYAGGKTDGALIVEGFSRNPVSQVLFAVLKIQGLIGAGVPLKEIDESLFLDVPQIAEDELYFIILTQLRFEYYEATGNDPEAYKYFLRYKDLIQYLPSEYRGDSVASKRAKIELEDEAEEMQEEETVTLEEIKAQVEQTAAKPETVEPVEETVEEQPAEEQAEEVTEEQPEEQEQQQQEENKDEE